jgi:hypothetical protein
MYRLIKKMKAGCQWLTPIILGTWEGEIGRIEVQSQPRQKSSRISTNSWEQWYTFVITSYRGG